MRWLSPPVRVQLHHADGRVSQWRLAGDKALPLLAETTSPPQVKALALSRDDVLDRQLVVPRLSGDDLARAVQLEVEAATPFGLGQTVSGYRVQGLDEQRMQVDIALTARQQVERALEAHSSDLGEPEVWVLPREGTRDGASTERAIQPIVVPPYGLTRRRGLLQRGRLLRIGAVLFVLALLAALAITPTAQLRLRAIAAQHAYDHLHQQSAPQVAQRDALTLSSDRLRALADLTHEQLVWLPVLDLLTRVVPDDASLYMLRLEGTKATLSGDAGDTAALVQALAREPGVKTVRLPAPVTRTGRSDKESFTIEVDFDPAVYGRARSAVSPAKEGE